VVPAAQQNMEVISNEALFSVIIFLSIRLRVNHDFNALCAEKWNLNQYIFLTGARGTPLFIYLFFPCFGLD
jgi:hypothetical protein